MLQYWPTQGIKMFEVLSSCLTRLVVVAIARAFLLVKNDRTRTVKHSQHPFPHTYLLSA